MSLMDDTTATSSDAEITHDVNAPSSGASESASTPPGQDTDATTGDDRAGLLAAVQDAVKPKETEGSPSSTEADATPGKDQDVENGTDDTAKPEGEAAEDQDDDEPTEAELRQYKPKTRARIERLLARTKELTGQVETLNSQVTAYNEFRTVLQESNLGQDDTAMLITLGAALKRGDFKTFLAGVEPYVNQARQAVGEVLPADLQDQVDNGYLTEEAARELATTRIRVRSLEAQDKARREQEEQARQAKAIQDYQVGVNAAVSSWEANVKATDPDYDAKQEAVLRYARAIAAERGAPRTPEDAVNMAQQALDEVNKTFRRVQPQVRPTRPTPSGLHTSTTAVPEPKTLMEAAMLGLRAGK